jgi:hypothetical protein
VKPTGHSLSGEGGGRSRAQTAHSFHGVFLGFPFLFFAFSQPSPADMLHGFYFFMMTSF